MSRKKTRLSRQSRKARRNNRSSKSQANSQLNLESLEARVLLDASGAITEVFENAQPTDFDGQRNSLPSLDSLAGIASQPVSVASSSLRHELIFVDAGLENQADLLAELQISRPGVLREVIEIDSSQSGLEQIARSVEGRTGIDAIHLISHGDTAELKLGSSVVDFGQLTGSQSAIFESIGKSLSVDADLLIYGCDFGAGDAGEEAAERLAEATGADVAVSDDLTGHASLGGDWELEVHVGAIQATQLAATGWQGVLLPKQPCGFRVKPATRQGFRSCHKQAGLAPPARVSATSAYRIRMALRPQSTVAIRLAWILNAFAPSQPRCARIF